MKLNKIAKITMLSSVVISIVNIFVDIDLSICVYLLIISSLLCYWVDEQNAHWDAVLNEHKAIINRIIAESVVLEIETEVESSKELWTKQELLEMIEEKKKNFEDFKE